MTLATPEAPPVRLRLRAARRWQGGWLRGVRWCASPNHNERPAKVATTLLVVHSISLPPGEFGGSAIEQLFSNRLDPRAHPSFEAVHQLRVSAHFVIRRDGEVVQFVDVTRRAWHAGVSQWRGRAGCNDGSVGVELEGLEGEHFAACQYAELVHLVRDLKRRLPLAEIVGHEHIAPGRKRDPGACFDGAWLQRQAALPGAW
jgi:N-acetyl-anhydromuramoyl-L-alanine amidase